MRLIYSRAQRVVVWLGDLPYAKKYADLLIARVPHLDDDEAGIRALGFIEDSAEETLINLIRRAWWSRAWVVQEVVAAQEVDVMFGEYRLHWKDFCGLIEHIQHLYVGPRLDPHKIPASVKEFVSRVKQLREGKNDPEWDLMNFVYAFRFQEASEPLDKLYAFRELINNPRTMQVVPDYSKPAAEVFRDFTRAYIEHYHDLRILSMMTESNHHGPTWCPNFSRKGREWSHSSGIISDPFQGKFSASGSRRVSTLLAHPDPLVLGIQGWLYDTVVAVGRRGPLVEEDDFAPTLKAWRQLAKVNKHRVIRVAFNHVTSAGQGFSIGMSYLFDMCLNRRFFITARGAYGIGPVQTRPGDRVCVLFGGDVPFVLRTSKSSHWLPRRIELKDEPWAYHTIVGLAYVQGIMNYEGDINQDVAEKKLIVEDFYLK
ncbi:hypothetical protein GQ44DRAFT_209800 [Phaeosphaeriaceae sp. PMI808]|nr:hypothetical protein GQ44DRAFT_209800 [Phaeosphaeriaceae sp. PMI808]